MTDSEQRLECSHPSFSFPSSSSHIYIHTFPLHSLFSRSLARSPTRRYDAAVYGYVSSYLESNFFPSSFPIGVWLGYASTFLLRPVGGVAVGRLADRYMSRGQASLLAIGAMTIATVLQVRVDQLIALLQYLHSPIHSLSLRAVSPASTAAASSLLGSAWAF